MLGAFLLAAVLGGCSSDTSTEPTSGAVTGDGGESGAVPGTLTLRMTDEPTDEICELHVFIADIRIKPDGSPQMLLGTEIGDFDLLTLQDGQTALLGTFSVEQGRYQFIELLLDQGRSHVVEKEDPADPDNLNCLETQSPLQVPSGKFKVNGGPFDVDENTQVTIDFDARKSLRKKGGNSEGDKGWRLVPDVSITQVVP